MHKVKPEDKVEILNELKEEAEGQVVISTDRTPGSTTPEGNKVTWTHKDQVARYKIVELEPDETIALTINGVKYQLIAGARHYVPEPVKAAYDLRKRNMRTLPKLPRIGFENVEDYGAGAMPPQSVTRTE